MTLDQDIIYNPTPESYATYMLGQIDDTYHSWADRVLSHTLKASERGDVDDREALRFVSAILFSRKFSQRRIAEKFSRRDPIGEIFDWVKETYTTLDDVRQWLKEEDVGEYMREKSVGTDWF